MSPPPSPGPLSPEAELEARSTFLELLAGFVGALGAGIAGSFASDPTVPADFAAILLGAGITLWIGVTTLSGFTWKRIKALRTGGAPVRRAFDCTWSGWTKVVVGTTIFVLALSVLVFWLGKRPDPDYASSYDGLDPHLTQCDDGATVIPDSSTSLLDLQGQTVGSVDLKASAACGTVWARVRINADDAPRLKGQIVHIEMLRQGDGKSVVYPLLISGQVKPAGSPYAEGWSNMVSATASCAEAHVYLMDGEKTGSLTKTGCKFEHF